ncbi:MAG: hypothetical protein JWN73_210 [Betaproteobacteria bacterium]|nr:hypothetical protein [Betaproteobacteria bacterium]
MGRHGGLARIALLALAVGTATPARAEPGMPAHAELDLALFRAASCDALVSEFAAVRDVNAAALKEMRRTDGASPDNTSAGVAVLASRGLRSTMQNENADETTALAELASYRQAIVTVAEEKKCALPGSGSGLHARPR